MHIHTQIYGIQREQSTELVSDPLCNITVTTIMEPAHHGRRLRGSWEDLK